MGIAAAAALVAGCSSSGGGNPSSNTTSNGGSTSSSAAGGGGGGSSTSSSNTGGGGGGLIGSAFCTGFNSSALAGLGSASTPSDVVKAWDTYAKNAPSEIKTQVQDIDKYLHDVVDKNYTDMQNFAAKIGADGQAIGAYYAAHCHA